MTKQEINDLLDKNEQFDLVVERGGQPYENEWEEMSLNGKGLYSVRDLCECPEDAIIARDLTCSHEVYSLMKIAYEAGKRGMLMTLTVEGND